MTSTLQALTAAGVTFAKSDFENPNLDGPTALTVTADGRVFGHLAKWGTCHIGHSGQCVTPPSTSQGYKYFHQGVVATEDGDLPVGKITLGTGHAALGEPAMAAAAHYDHTGAVVATVRAGEDQHGIWLAGRVVPGTAPERVDELRRSGVSGDWRGVDGALELVAALAVNVPGFPVPRTEQLVAAGGVETLIAAGVVVPPAPVTTDDLEVLVSSAVDDRVNAILDRRDRVSAARATMSAIVASANADRRQAAVDEVARVQAAQAAEAMELTAAGPSDMPSQLHVYWTRGAGLARWAKSAHPFTALVRALRQEITGKPDAAIKGIAANLYKSVFGVWPGSDGAVTAAGGRRVRSMDGAKKFGVGIGDLIPQALLDKAGDAAEGAGKAIAELVDPDRKKKPKDGKSSDKVDEAHTEPVATATEKPADKSDDGGKPKAADAKVDKKKPDEKKEDAKGGDAEKPKIDPKADGLEAETVAKDASKSGAKQEPSQVKASEPEKAKAPTDAEKEKAPKADKASTPPAAAPAPAAPSTDGDGGGGADTASSQYFPADYPPAESSYADQEIGSPIDTTAPARLADNGGTGGPMEEDELPAVGANGGALVDYADGMAIYEDGSVTDGTEWTAADSSMIENAAAARAMDMQSNFADDPTVIQTDVPPRASGYGVYMEEDQSPEVGANGGALTDYSDGVATYDDGTSTNGVLWREVEPVPATPPPPEAIAASAAHRRAMKRIGFTSHPAAWKRGGARPKA